MKKRRLLAMLLTLVMLACAGLAGCGGNESAGDLQGSGQGNEDVDPEGKTTITFWHLYSGITASRIADMVATFNKNSDEYYVEVTSGMTASSIASKLSSSSQEYYPSLFTGTSYAISEYAEEKYVRPIQDFVDKDDVDWTSDLTSYARNAYTDTEGVLIGVPIGISSRGYFVNLDILKQAGYTLDDIDSFNDIVEISKAAVKKGFIDYGYSPADGADIMDMLLYSGVDLVNNDNGKSGYPTAMMYQEGKTNEALRQLLNLHADLYKSGAGYENTAGAAGGLKLFASGKVLFNASTSSNYIEIVNIGTDFEWAFIPFQGLENGNSYKGQALVEGTGLFICDKKNDKETQGAYELVKFLLSEEQQSEWCTYRGYISPMKNVLENEEYVNWMNEKYPSLANIDKQLSNKDVALDFPVIDFYNYMIQENKAMLTSIMSEPGTDVDALIQKATDTLNKAIKVMNMRRSQ